MKPGLVDQHGRPIRSKSNVSTFYRGTWGGRVRAPMANQVGDSRATLNAYSRQTLLGYARTIYSNQGEVKGAIDDKTTYSVGHGIRPQSLAGAAAEEYEQFFEEWAKLADLSGQRSFWDLQRLASRRMDVDGDIGFNMVSGAGDWPFLEAIEGHRIQNPRGDTEAFDGVQYSPRTGKPLAYFVKAGDRFKRIPARNFILVYDPDRVNQYRGVTALAHAILDIWDISEILEYEKIGVKAREAIGFIVKTSGGGDGDLSGLIENGNKAADTGDLDWQTLKAGYVPKMGVEEDIHDLAGNRPSPTFQGFLELLMRKTAVGLGLPFEFVWDPTNAGGATQRAVLAKAQRTFSNRARLIEDRLNTRVWGWVISKAIKRGDVRPSNDWYRVRWQHPKKITVDVGREAKERREDIKLGITTLAEDAAERGIDWLEVRDQVESETRDLIERARLVADDYGISLDLAINLLSQRSPNPPIETEPKVA